MERASHGFSLAFRLTALASAVGLGVLFALTEHSIHRRRGVTHATLAAELAPAQRAPERTEPMDASVTAPAGAGLASAHVVAAPAVSDAGAPTVPLPHEEPLAATLPGTDARCPSNAVLVEGEYCERVAERCLEWAPGDRRRCLRFESPMRCAGRRRHMAFCIDRYEWPNERGAQPVVMVSWLEAEQMCASRGRRLCTQDEWTFACEGEQMLPYGYGFEREPDRCTVDHYAAAPDRALLDSPRRDVALGEAERVYEGTVSGHNARCATPFGAYDMVGNVDEWTVNESGWPFRSALKGGWWGRIRGRCRPATLAHYERFRYYQIGFRCCANDAAAAAAGPTPNAEPAGQPRHHHHHHHRDDPPPTSTSAGAAPATSAAPGTAL